MIAHSVIALCLLLGSVVILIAALGVLRLPDAPCRSHALGKGMTLGIMLILIGLWIFLGTEESGIKLPIAVLFQFLTIPIASHLLIRLAWRNRQRDRQGTEAAAQDSR